MSVASLAARAFEDLPRGEVIQDLVRAESDGRIEQGEVDALIFVICVLTFRRGVIGELGRLIGKPL